MTTTFDAHAHQQSLKRTQNYAAQPGLLNELEWRPAELGDVVYYGDEEEPFIFIAVAKVSPHKLKVGQSGNYIGDEYGALKKAKYQIFLTRSLQLPFKKDFDQVYDLLNSLQNKAAITSNIKNLLFNEAGSKLIRCTRDIFVPKPQEPKKTPPHDQQHDEDENSEREDDTDSADDEPEIDKVTQHWRVPREFQAEFQSIIHAYRAVPFPVYYNDSLCEPTKVKRDLSNAIIEVAFTLHHNYIPNNKMDSFQAHVIQIKILRKGVPSSSSLAEPHQGPISMYKPLPSSPSTPLKAKELQSTSNPRKRPTEDEPTFKKSSRKKKKVEIPDPSNDDKGEGTSGANTVHQSSDLT